MMSLHSVQHTPKSHELFSRERLLGNNRSVMEHATVTIIGSGSVANNMMQTFTLLGIGTLQTVDFDHVEVSNLTRSPLFRDAALSEERPVYKSEHLARAALALSFAERPTTRFAVAPIEALGRLVFTTSHVVVSAVDSVQARRYLANETRLLGIPLVDVGFRGYQGQVMMFDNQEPDAPCWNCLHPELEHQRASCLLYARQAMTHGYTPATQTVAATLSNIAAEAVVQALHGAFPLNGKSFSLDIRRGMAHTIQLSSELTCPGEHRRLTNITPIPITNKQTVAELFAAIHPCIPEPILHLPSPVVMNAPCLECGHSLELWKPEWAITSAPQCTTCPDVRPAHTAPPRVESTIAYSDDLLHTPLANFGLAAGTIVEIEHSSTRERFAFHLQGSLDDLFCTLRRTLPNVCP